MHEVVNLNLIGLQFLKKHPQIEQTFFSILCIKVKTWDKWFITGLAYLQIWFG
jgi:hypothetical protein